MKYFFSIAILLMSISAEAQTDPVSPLANYSSEWNNPDSNFTQCNTAIDAVYMSPNEKDVIYILNLVRSSPVLFVNTVLKKRKDLQGKYCNSLTEKLLTMQPLNLLVPDEKCYNSAECHAESGIHGYVGHVRQTTSCKEKQYFDGECCDYGHNVALEIVLSLLVDDGVPSLIHRTIFLGEYNGVGVSVQSHSKYRYVSVLDFHY
ncbi:MAG TPA: hypothetical protein VK559_11260 [Ferruginibacter sp.]|nr:hypothetical protein [Ferruginibacter sp.]